MATIKVNISGEDKREIYYAVESLMTANYANENPDEFRIYIHGKEDMMLFSDGEPTGWGNRDNLSAYFVRKYGYKSESDARRNWSYKHPENTKYWQTETRIVRLWVRKDGKVWKC